MNGFIPAPTSRRHRQPAGHHHRPARHRPAGDRHHGKRARQRRAGGDQGRGADRLHRPDPAGRSRHGQLHALRAQRLVRLVGSRHGRRRRRGLDLLRLCRLRRRLDRGRGDQEPAAQRADRPDRLAGHLHHLLPAGRRRRDRRRRRPAGRSAPTAQAVAARLARASSPPAPLAEQRRPLVCSKEALAHVLREIGWPQRRQPARPRRRARPALGHPDDDVRPDPHLLRDGARRPAAGRPAPRSTRSSRRRYIVTIDHRRRRGARRGLLPGRPAGRHLELRHAVRLRHGVDRGAWSCA